MSKHIFSANDVTVTLGYDRPLDCVFMTVERKGCLAYSNLSDPHAGTEQQNVDYYRSILFRMKIPVPEELFTQVKLDQCEHEGNRVVHYHR